MWIKMTGTYSGAHGQFYKGLKYDLPPDILQFIPKDSFVECSPHWDEHKDHDAMLEMMDGMKGMKRF